MTEIACGGCGKAGVRLVKEGETAYRRVIGAATDRRGRSHAFVGERGRMTVVPGLGGTLSAPTAINGAGALILPGYCLDEKF